MVRESLYKRKQEVEQALTNCTLAEYPALAVEYSKIVNDIEAEQFMFSPALKNAEKKQMLSQLVREL